MATGRNSSRLFPESSRSNPTLLRYLPSPDKSRFSQYMKLTVLLIALCASVVSVTAQEAVYFLASDSTKVNAHLYFQNNRYPFIILCHEGKNTNEYGKVAPRLLNLNYNCLSVALRNDGTVNAARDIEAAIDFSKRISNQPVILAGSTRSASLCLLSAGGNPDVKAVIALSPGEYFQPSLKISDAVKTIDKLVFASATQSEFPYLQQMFAGTELSNITLFKPEKNSGYRGSAALDDSNPASSEYWFALMMFFKKLDMDR